MEVDQNDPYHLRNEEGLTRTSASPRPRQYYHDPLLLQQGSLPDQPAVVCAAPAWRPRAFSPASYAEATVSMVDSWPLKDLTPTQAVRDHPTDGRARTSLLSIILPALLIPPPLLQHSFRALTRQSSDVCLTSFPFVFIEEHFPKTRLVAR